MAEKKISAKAVVADIEAGMSNDEMRKKYGLSSVGLRCVFDKLLNANLLSPEEHNLRVAPMAQPSRTSSGRVDHPLPKPAIIEASDSLHSKTRIPEPEFAQNEFPLHDGPARSTDAAESSKPQSHGDNGPQAASETVPMNFIDVSKEGKNRWWRYLLGIMFMVIFSVGSTEIFRVVFLSNAKFDDKTGRLMGVDPFCDYILLSFSFVFLLLAIFLVVRVEHKRPFMRLITANQFIDWSKLGRSFIVFCGLMALSELVSYALSPESYRFSLNPDRFFLFAPIVLILTPIQTTTEEILFRGYLLQMIGLLTKNRIILVFVSGVLFTLPHLANPEIALGIVPMCLFYFACGSFLTIVTLKGNGLEVAIGIHSAINLFNALIVNYSNSPLATESIFVFTELNPTFSLVAFCLSALVFYFVMFGRDAIWQKRLKPNFPAAPFDSEKKCA